MKTILETGLKKRKIKTGKEKFMINHEEQYYTEEAKNLFIKEELKEINKSIKQAKKKYSELEKLFIKTQEIEYFKKLNTQDNIIQHLKYIHKRESMILENNFHRGKWEKQWNGVWKWSKIKEKNEK